MQLASRALGLPMDSLARRSAVAGLRKAAPAGIVCFTSKLAAENIFQYLVNGSRCLRGQRLRRLFQLEAVAGTEIAVSSGDCQTGPRSRFAVFCFGMPADCTTHFRLVFGGNVRGWHCFVS